MGHMGRVPVPFFEKATILPGWKAYSRILGLGTRVGKAPTGVGGAAPCQVIT